MDNQDSGRETESNKFSVKRRSETSPVASRRKKIRGDVGTQDKPSSGTVIASASTATLTYNDKDKPSSGTAIATASSVTPTNDNKNKSSSNTAIAPASSATLTDDNKNKSSSRTTIAPASSTTLTDDNKDKPLSNTAIAPASGATLTDDDKDKSSRGAAIALASSATLTDDDKDKSSSRTGLAPASSTTLTDDDKDKPSSNAGIAPASSATRTDDNKDKPSSRTAIAPASSTTLTDENKCKSSSRTATTSASQATLTDDNKDKSASRTAMISSSCVTLTDDATQNSDDSDSDVDKPHGMIRPSLLKQLQVILDEYPDDAQIIRELVQNAEDAGASELRIFHDQRRTPLPENNEYDKYFRTPALCVYNNEKFRQQDWDGIITVYDSNKQKDALKVGRFGLGFKSVFHMTDHPVIISGNRLLIIDPCKGEDECIPKRFKTIAKEASVEHALEPIFGMFGFTPECISRNCYNGTLFWFTLREQGSALSDNLYSCEKMQTLIKSFEKESTMTLLFLRNMKKICIHSETAELRCPSLVVEHRVNSNYAKDIQNFHKCLRDSVQTQNKSCVFRSSMIMTKNDDLISLEKWAIINLFKGNENMSNDMKTLIEDKSLSYCPLVGIAVLTSPLMNTVCEKPWLGHVFCFLPLPSENESLTGLPVHVNGFFALSQNRRHVKWPSSKNEDLSDKATQWNQLLCREVLVDAYVEMFDVLKGITIEESFTDPSDNLVYKALPNISLVHCHWSAILDPLYEAIFAKDIFYSHNDGGKWIPFSEAIFSIFEWTQPEHAEDIEDSVLDILFLCKENIVHLPGHLKNALMKYCPNCNKISPGYVRNILKSNECYKDKSKMQKLYLLEFVISDVENNSEDLEHLELLPLMDGSFATFDSKNTTETVYISTECKEHTLFPKLENRFADVDVEQGWGRRISDFATEGLYQLKSFEWELFPLFFKETLRLNGNVDSNSVYYSPTSENLPLSLLSKIWDYLNQKFESLSDLNTLHIIPTQTTCGLKLLKLKGFYVLKSADGMKTLPAGVQEALSALSITVIDDIPSTIHHPKLRGAYCKFPTGRNIVDLLQRMNIQYDFSANAELLQDLKQKFNGICSSNAKREFTKYLAEESVCIPTEAKEILKGLELFVQSGNDQTEDTLVSISRNKLLACQEPFPYPFPIPYLVFDKVTSPLAIRLDAVQLSWKDIIIKALECIAQDDQSNSPYSGKLILDFMEYFVNNLLRFKNESTEKEYAHALELAKQIKFVSSASGRVFKPGELFDPDDVSLRDLFTFLPDSFPCKKFSTRSAVFGLKSLGLKSQAEVSASDILQVAKNIHSLHSQKTRSNEISKSARELLKVLQKDAAKELMKRPFISSLKSLCWVPFVFEKPSNYPIYMPWYGSEVSERLCSPEQCCTFEFMAIAGSATCFIDVEKDSNIANAFGWNIPPSIDLVVKQLKVVIEVYQKKDMEIDLGILKSIYTHFSDSDANKLDVSLKDTPFVFHRNGFCSPSDVYIDFPDEVDAFDLSPYMYRLPDEFNKMRDVFIAFGCFEKLNVENFIKVLQSIRENHQETLAQRKVERDRKLAIAILQTISKIVTEDYDMGAVLVPVAAEPCKLVMRPTGECTYDDIPQKNYTFDLEDDENDEFKADIYVHPDVTARLAESLHIPSLTKRFMSDNDATEMMVDWGQSEPLTVRLSNLLEGYGDGFSVIKELIQNAEDAGASEVRFLYDERQNEHLKTRVIENMAECQGPAFWAFNNAMFEEKDFENIIKLGGRTKEPDRYKIGKFGLGFCSVYNLTDVPSFISGNTLVILDPHTTYLGKAISKKDNPGIRINFKNRAILNRYKNQFEPYNNVFGCTLSKEQFPPNFKGSLFRFPLRTKPQAAMSDIKKLHYSHKEIVNLMEKFESSVGNLLLFTQKLEKVELWHLSEDADDPSSASMILRASKRVLQTIPYEFGNSSAIIQAGNIIDDAESNTADGYKKIEKILVEITMVPNKLKGSGKNQNCEAQWLVSWSSGSCNAVQRARSLKENGALSLGSVALPICIDGDPEVDLSKLPNTFYRESHMFCFLPLPEVCSTPVHINGCFAVENDRKRICRTSEDEKTTGDSDWNTILLSDVVCDAYIHLMEYLNINCHKDSESYAELWPKYKNAIYDIPELTEAFYLKVIKDNPCVFHNGVKTSEFENCLFLESSLRHNDNVGRIAYELLLRFYEGDKEVMDMTEEVISQFKQFGCQEYIEGNTLSVLDFYRTIIFPNLRNIQDDERNALMLFALSHYESLRELLEETNCIPTSQSNESLKKPRDLVKPNSVISSLFNTEDGRFPTKSFQNEMVIGILIDLGMMHDELPPPMLLERANSVADLPNDHEQIKRCKNILKYVKSKTGLDTVLAQMSSIPFLPVLRKPKYWPICWNGIQQESEITLQLDSPENLYFEDTKDLIGSVRNVVDVKYLGKEKQDILKKLGVSDKSNITFKEVVQQLHCIADISDNIQDLISKEVHQLYIITSNIYIFFEEILTSSPLYGNQLRDLQTKNILFWGNRLIRPDKTTFDNTSILKLNYEPEIYIMDPEFKKKYKTFLENVGVPLELDKMSIVNVYEGVQEKCGDQILNDQQVNLISNLLRLLSECIKRSRGKLTENEKERILVPDDQARLRNHRELCIDDGYTMLQKQDYMHFVNENIPPVVQKLLNIRSKRQQHLNKISCSMPFGQKEELVTRIGNILHDYPYQESILKEMLQNADDAGASEITFILDLRQHDKTNIFGESWKALQGPALCVFNDTCFSEEDLRGITKLGTGSKSQDPSKTGQFGIGFNAVYHVTDAPSFITRGNATPNGGTYCVFDPHCRFCPTATDDQPGMRIEHLGDLKETYPDVYQSYLQDVIQRNQGTWFRFPLRTSDLAYKSRLSSKPTTEDDVITIFRRFKDDMLKSLLFLRNVKVISLARIGHTSEGWLETIYKVEAEITVEDRSKMGKFFQQCDELSSALKNNQKLIDSLPVFHVGYNILLRDSDRKMERWLVVQNCGHSSSVDIPDELPDILRSGEIGFSPRGGVAIRIYENIIQQNAMDEIYIYSKSRESDYAFCLLPLSSVHTGLPVCINGHFALDPARQYLKTDDKYVTPQGLWNKFLTENIISDAYVKMLELLKEYIFQACPDVSIQNLKTEDDVLTKKLLHFSAAFPMFNNATDPTWKNLVTSVYYTILQKESELFPVIINNSVKWVALQSQGHKFPAFFNELESNIVRHEEPLYAKNLEKTEQKIEKEKKENHRKAVSLTESLKNLGMKLTDLPIYHLENILLSLQNDRTVCNREVAETYIENIRRVTEKDILEFLLSEKTEYPDRCIIENVGRDIKMTAFKCISNIKILIELCLFRETELFASELKELPLLVTNDGKLHRFKDVNPLYISFYCSLLLSSKANFVHTDLVHALQQITPKRNDVVKPLDLSAFVAMLPQSVDRNHLCKDEPIVWDDKDNHLPSYQWIRQFWKFIDSQDVDPLVILQKLGNWCFVPFLDNQNKKQRTLVSINLSHIVMHWMSFSNVVEMQTFKSLNLPEPLDISTTLGNLVASSKSPERVIECLHFHKHCLKKVDKHTSNNILMFFNNRLPHDMKYRKMLSSLPLYQTVTGNSTTLDKSMNIRIINESGCPNLVKEGLDTWVSRSNYILLNNNLHLYKLFSFLGLKYVTVAEFYEVDLLPNFRFLCQGCHLKHLEYIRDNINFRSTNFVMILKDTDFIPNENRLVSARHYFNPNIDLFRLMCKTSQFPPEPYNHNGWLQFMICAGMQNNISTSLYVDFAKDLELRLIKDGITKELELKSKAMVKHLFKRKDIFHETLLDDICGIRFLISHRIAEQLLVISSQSSVDGPISFSESVSCGFEQLVWTTLPLLPCYADPSSALPSTENNKITTFQRKLNIFVSPPLKNVISHIHNVCHSLRKIFEKSKVGSKDSRISDDCLATLMSKFYTYLKDYGVCNEAKVGLSETPLVHVKLKNDLNYFVKPNQITVSLQQEDEIQPYLFKMPMKYGAYCELFEYYGTTAKPHLWQYANVLKCLYDAQLATSGCLTPREGINAKKAYDCLVMLLTDRKKEEVVADLKNVTIIYLLSEEKRIVKSSDLIAVDDKRLNKRLENQGLLFLLRIKNTDAFKKLPDILKPQFLTDIVEERLVSSEEDSVSENKFSRMVESLLRSKHFLRGVDRYAEINASKIMNEPMSEKISDAFKVLRVRCLNQIVTVLKIRGTELHESTGRVDCYYSKERKIFFLHTHFSDIRDFLKKVKQHVCMSLCKLTHQRLEQLQMEKLFDFIDDLADLKVFVDDLMNEVENEGDDENEWYPEIGSIVPKALHILLENNFSDLPDGECVAHELWDPDIDGEEGGKDAIYIYVKVLHKVPGPSTNNLHQKYLVDMGSNTEKVVHAVTLYIFNRKETISCSDLVLYTDGHDGEARLNKDRIFMQIRETLTDAWKQDKKVRKRIVKRLLLRWHPDKNIGNEEFCKEVTQYILEVIGELENDNVGAGTGTTYGGRSNWTYTPGARRKKTYAPKWSSFADKMHTRGSRNYDYYRQYKHYWTSSSSSPHIPNPQPCEAKRWMHQAGQDLRSAKVTMNSANEDKTPIYNWVCVQCHQACEKACKAVGISIDNDKVNKRTHCLTQVNNCIPVTFSDNVTKNICRMEALVGSYSRMRYPGSADFPKIPSQLYTEENAKEAIELAICIVDELSEML